MIEVTKAIVPSIFTDVNTDIIRDISYLESYKHNDIIYTSGTIYHIVGYYFVPFFPDEVENIVDTFDIVSTKSSICPLGFEDADFEIRSLFPFSDHLDLSPIHLSKMIFYKCYCDGLNEDGNSPCGDCDENYMSLGITFERHTRFNLSTPCCDMSSSLLKLKGVLGG